MYIYERRVSSSAGARISTRVEPNAKACLPFPLSRPVRDGACPWGWSRLGLEGEESGCITHRQKHQKWLPKNKLKSIGHGPLWLLLLHPSSRVQTENSDKNQGLRVDIYWSSIEFRCRLEQPKVEHKIISPANI
eukprot:1357630-Amorphochlora_amoeboformis.AAC.1